MVAAGIAMAEAEKGNKVLLAELGARSFFEKLFQRRYGPKPTALIAGLDMTRWEGKVCVREYLLHYLRLERAVDVFLNNKVMGPLVRAAPGLDEVVLMGKITSGHRHRWHSLHYDVVVVDAFATGHFMALLRAPRGLYETVTVGPMASNCKEMLEVIGNPDLCRYVIVTLPEELPVTETLELHEQIQSEVGISADVVCNKVLPSAYAAEVQRLHGHAGADEASCMGYLDACYQRQSAALENLAEVIENVRTIPYYFQTEPHGLVRSIAGSM
jgi:anion-transporting  ArsA/GET3 family ATPase